MEKDNFGVNSLEREDTDPQRNAGRLITVLDLDYGFSVIDLRKFEHNQQVKFPGIDIPLTLEWNTKARNVVRTFFAYLEGTVYSLKVYADIQFKNSLSPLKPHEIDAVYEETHTINEKGIVETKSMNIRLIPNILFMIKLQKRVHGISKDLDKNSEWWALLKESVEVRNRITHPKTIEDIHITRDEIENILLVAEGFNELLTNFLGPRPWVLPNLWDKIKASFHKEANISIDDLNTLMGPDFVPNRFAGN